MQTSAAFIASFELTTSGRPYRLLPQNLAIFPPVIIMLLFGYLLVFDFLETGRQVNLQWITRPGIVSMENTVGEVDA